MANLSEVVVNLGNSTNMLRKQVTKKGLRRSKERRKCFLYFAPLPLLVLYGKGRANTAQLHDTYHPVEVNILQQCKKVLHFNLQANRVY